MFHVKFNKIFISSLATHVVHRGWSIYYLTKKKRKNGWISVLSFKHRQFCCSLNIDGRRRKRIFTNWTTYLHTMMTIIDIKWQIKIRTPYLNRIMNSISRTLLHSWNLRLIKFSIINAKLSVREVLFIRHNIQLKASWAES